MEVRDGFMDTHETSWNPMEPHGSSRKSPWKLVDMLHVTFHGRKLDVANFFMEGSMSRALPSVRLPSMELPSTSTKTSSTDLNFFHGSSNNVEYGCGAVMRFCEVPHKKLIGLVPMEGSGMSLLPSLSDISFAFVQLTPDLPQTSREVVV